MTPHRTRLAGAVLAAGLLTAACGASSDAPKQAAADAAPAGPNDVTVKLVALKFDPKQVTVTKGTRVVWEWTDELVHNVSAADFRSANISGPRYAHTFDQAGTFSYQCTLHTGMTGTVTVTG